MSIRCDKAHQTLTGPACRVWFNHIHARRKIKMSFSPLENTRMSSGILLRGWHTIWCEEISIESSFSMAVTTLIAYSLWEQPHMYLGRVYFIKYRKIFWLVFLDLGLPSLNYILRHTWHVMVANGVYELMLLSGLPFQTLYAFSGK